MIERGSINDMRRLIRLARILDTGQRLVVQHSDSDEKPRNEYSDICYGLWTWLDNIINRIESYPKKLIIEDEERWVDPRDYPPYNREE
jgi:hypothetical protein